ncbi:MAG: hypothetical protein KatS3mg105_2446 [Gemmatales bacterium]|nr:MAG: hypothetical protein KatS3mg105_2446 [Gemmatales bacterium]
MSTPSADRFADLKLLKPDGTELPIASLPRPLLLIFLRHLA